MKHRLRLPSGRKRGAANRPGPFAVIAVVNQTSPMGAEQNHLCPVRL